MDDDGKLMIFDEVDMEEVIEEWAECYAEGVEVGDWFYDCARRTLFIRLLVNEGFESGDVIRGEKRDE